MKHFDFKRRALYLAISTAASFEFSCFVDIPVVTFFVGAMLGVISQIIPLFFEL